MPESGQGLVSGHHTEVRYESGRYVLADLGSSSSTFVNNRRTTGPNMIKAGWPVKLGDEQFIVTSQREG